MITQLESGADLFRRPDGGDHAAQGISGGPERRRVLADRRRTAPSETLRRARGSGSSRLGSASRPVIRARPPSRSAPKAPTAAAAEEAGRRRRAASAPRACQTRRSEPPSPRPAPNEFSARRRSRSSSPTPTSDAYGDETPRTSASAPPAPSTGCPNGARPRKGQGSERRGEVLTGERSPAPGRCGAGSASDRQPRRRRPRVRGAPLGTRDQDSDLERRAQGTSLDAGAD